MIWCCEHDATPCPWGSPQIGALRRLLTKGVRGGSPTAKPRQVALGGITRAVVCPSPLPSSTSTSTSTPEGGEVGTGTASPSGHSDDDDGDATAATAATAAAAADTARGGVPCVTEAFAGRGVVLTADDVSHLRQCGTKCPHRSDTDAASRPGHGDTAHGGKADSEEGSAAECAAPGESKCCSNGGGGARGQQQQQQEPATDVGAAAGGGVRPTEHPPHDRVCAGYSRAATAEALRYQLQLVAVPSA